MNPAMDGRTNLSLLPNTVGRDFFVGDLHGCFDLLQAELDRVQFDRTKDRLISVGDLADRGFDSVECVELLYEPWFFAVRGNHEDMAIGVWRGTWSSSNFVANGGRWFFQQPESERERLVSLMERMPFVLSVPVGDKMIGVVHGDCLVQHWNEYAILENWESVLWGRDRISNDIVTPVNGVDVVVVGHTPVQKVEKLGNVLYIDTGAVYKGTLTLMSSLEVLNYE